MFLGKSGAPINLTSNYFQLMQSANWCLYHYHVDFAPTEDNTRIKRKLFYTATKDKVIGYIFDGSAMFTPRRFPEDVTEFFVNSESGDQTIRITVKLVSDVAPYDHTYLQIFNLIIRKCMSYLKLQLVQRNYYDAAAKVFIYLLLFRKFLFHIQKIHLPYFVLLLMLMSNLIC